MTWKLESFRSLSSRLKSRNQAIAYVLNNWVKISDDNIADFWRLTKEDAVTFAEIFFPRESSQSDDEYFVLFCMKNKYGHDDTYKNLWVVTREWSQSDPEGSNIPTLVDITENLDKLLMENVEDMEIRDAVQRKDFYINFDPIVFASFSADKATKVSVTKTNPFDDPTFTIYTILNRCRILGKRIDRKALEIIMIRLINYVNKFGGKDLMMQNGLELDPKTNLYVVGNFDQYLKDVKDYEPFEFDRTTSDYLLCNQFLNEDINAYANDPNFFKEIYKHVEVKNGQTSDDFVTSIDQTMGDDTGEGM